MIYASKKSFWLQEDWILEKSGRMETSKETSARATHEMTMAWIRQCWWKWKKWADLRYVLEVNRDVIN